MRRGNGEGEDGAKVRVSLSSLLGRVRVRTARVRVKRDEGDEDGARARVFRSFRSFRSSSHWDDGQVIQSGPRSPSTLS